MKAIGATSISPRSRRARDDAARQDVGQRLEDRPQIGVDLFQQVAGQEAEPLAGLDRRPGDDQTVDLLAASS